MNIANNKRKKESQEKIEKVFVEMLQTKELNEITIMNICKKANLNRSTFYSNYLDVYDLAEKIREKLEEDVQDLYKDEINRQYNSNNFLKLFYHIKENQIFYKTYFKLGFDKSSIIKYYDYNQAEEYYNSNYIDYHITFFKAGLNAIIQKWLNNGCAESPEEIMEIIKLEYKK